MSAREPLHLPTNRHEFWSHMSRKAYGIALYLTKFDHHRARDVRQEALLKLVRKEPEKSRDDLWRMLPTTVRNTYLDHLKGEKKRPTIPMTAEPPAVGPVPREPAIAEAIEKLPREARDVLHLRYSCDLTFREIAALLHLGKDQIRYKCEKALAKLRALLDRGESS